MVQAPLSCPIALTLHWHMLIGPIRKAQSRVTRTIRLKVHIWRSFPAYRLTRFVRCSSRTLYSVVHSLIGLHADVLDASLPSRLAGACCPSGRRASASGLCSCASCCPSGSLTHWHTLAHSSAWARVPLWLPSVYLIIRAYRISICICTIIEAIIPLAEAMNIVSVLQQVVRGVLLFSLSCVRVCLGSAQLNCNNVAKTVMRLRTFGSQISARGHARFNDRCFDAYAPRSTCYSLFSLTRTFLSNLFGLFCGEYCNATFNSEYFCTLVKLLLPSKITNKNILYKLSILVIVVYPACNYTSSSIN